MPLPAVGALLARIGFATAARSVAASATRLGVKGAGAAGRLASKAAKGKLPSLSGSASKSSARSKKGRIAVPKEFEETIDALKQFRQAVSDWKGDKKKKPDDREQTVVDNSQTTVNVENPEEKGKAETDERPLSGGAGRGGGGDGAPTEPAPGGDGDRPRDDNPEREKQRREGETAFGKLWKSAKAAAAALTAGATALVTFTVAVRNVSVAVSERRRFQAQYDPGTAVSFAKLDRERLIRDIRSSQAQSESVQRLNESLNKLEESLLPYQIAINMGINEVVSYAVKTVDLLTIAVEYWFPEAMAKLKEITGERKETRSNAIAEAIHKWAEENRQAQKSQRKRRAGP